MSKDFLVMASGKYINCAVDSPVTNVSSSSSDSNGSNSSNSSVGKQPYRLYRFLTDLENILDQVKSDELRLKRIFPLVRRLLTESDWLQGEFREPDPDLGWSVLTLYEEPDFPLTVQTVVWLPGRHSPIHNHGTWGVVAVINGAERNRFWHRSPEPKHPDRIELVDERVLVPGEIIGFTPEAIHSVEVIGETPTVTFNLYGETDFQQRFEFDPVTHQATGF
ncbi:MAG: cupin [Oscillatoriales cyanobacterium RM2_1_1]|nr:cupin [Oscillatoriales cyanobacterium SM2_3_0]NJO46750.1 cupin [Oscillatoriales cyanobacterium RM2_1_1]